MSENKTDAELSLANRTFYDSLWSGAKLILPEKFNTWPLVQSLIADSKCALEVAPGLRPRLPLRGTHFVDISTPALTQLQRRGGRTIIGSAMSLPYPNHGFDFVCALDVLEHLQDDDRVLSELSRVTAPGAVLLIATPLFASCWTQFDDFVGHCRRYEPEALVSKLQAHGFMIEQSAAYGMQAKSSRVLDWGIWWMTHHRQRAMRWYNRVSPFAVRFQKPLKLKPGMVVDTGVDEIFLVCRKKRDATTMPVS